jgi:hypothetical protein
MAPMGLVLDELQSPTAFPRALILAALVGFAFAEQVEPLGGFIASKLGVAQLVFGVL